RPSARPPAIAARKACGLWRPMSFKVASKVSAMAVALPPRPGDSSSGPPPGEWPGPRPKRCFASAPRAGSATVEGHLDLGDGHRGVLNGRKAVGALMPGLPALGTVFAKAVPVSLEGFHPKGARVTLGHLAATFPFARRKSPRGKPLRRPDHAATGV